MQTVRLEYTPLKNRKKPTIRNGVMTKVIVYQSGAMIGYGFVILFSDGNMSAPALFDLAGEGLPDGMYNLVYTDKNFNVVCPTRIQ